MTKFTRGRWPSDDEIRKVLVHITLAPDEFKKVKLLLRRLQDPHEYHDDDARQRVLAEAEMLAWTCRWLEKMNQELLPLMPFEQRAEADEFSAGLRRACDRISRARHMLSDPTHDYLGAYRAALAAGDLDPADIVSRARFQPPQAKKSLRPAFDAVRHLMDLFLSKNGDRVLEAARTVARLEVLVQARGQKPDHRHPEAPSIPRRARAIAALMRKSVK
ncbi:MAG: hypothetical protein HY815_16980 [Candidatus Riflebacteria bacterium]|nr:hypothetical protein [Candidatus Riflebacteria bacterium]